MRPEEPAPQLPPGEREELRRLVIEGCQVMRDEYEGLDRDWNSATDEVWRNNG